MTANILVEQGGPRLSDVRFALAASPGSGLAVSGSKVVAHQRYTPGAAKRS